MQYDVKTPQDYLEQLEDDWRRAKLLALRRMIHERVPEIEESINYKMLRYGNESSTLCHLNAQRNYVSLYVGDAKKIDPDGKLLASFDVGKGCIRIKKSVVLAETQIEAFLQKAIGIWQEGGDLSC